MREVVERPSPIDWSGPCEEFSEEHFERIRECDDENLRRIEFHLHISEPHSKEDNERIVLICTHRLGRYRNSLGSWLYLAAAYERMGRFKEAYFIYVNHVTRLEGSTTENEGVMKRLKLKLEGRYWPGKYTSLDQAYRDKLHEARNETLKIYLDQAEANNDNPAILLFNEEFMRRDPSRIDNNLRKACILKRMGKFKEALPVFERVLELQIQHGKNSVETWSNILKLRAKIAAMPELVAEVVKEDVNEVLSR